MTDDLKSDRRRAHVANLCDKWGAVSGDERWRRAAGVLRGKRSGRREIDDSAAKAFVAKLVEQGWSKNEACTEAATISSPTRLAFDATKARLMKKC